MLLLDMSEAVELSIVNGVGGCGWTISIKEVQMRSEYLQLKNNAPSSDSAADEITGFIMLLLVRMAPLLGGVVSCGCG